MDDVTAGADTKFEGIAVMQARRLKVTDMLVVIDRLQGGSRALQAIGARHHSVFHLDRLLSFYVGEGLLADTERNRIIRYIADNQFRV